jgi:hypothetical protein
VKILLRQNHGPRRITMQHLADCIRFSSYGRAFG